MFKSEFTDEAFLDNPAPKLEELRREGELVRRKVPIVGNIWFTTTHHAAATLLKDNHNFSQRRANGKVPGMQWWMPKGLKLLAGNMLASDEPDHSRLRHIVDQAFHRRSISALHNSLEQMANRLLDQLFLDGAEADLVEKFSRQFPLMVICELLGLPQSDRGYFIKWAGKFSEVNGIWSLIGTFSAIGKLNGYLADQIAKAKQNGGNGLIAELVHQQQTGANITDDELLAMVFLLLVAGHETTTHLISGSVLALLQNTQQRELLVEDWDRLPMAVEEFLRFVSAVAMTKPRYCHSTTRFGDISVEAGDIVMPLLVAANYDPAIFERPETLNIMRKPNRHIGFGAGIHFCLGNQLARMETAVALQSLFTRNPNLSLASAGYEWQKRFGLRSLKHLHVSR